MGTYQRVRRARQCALSNRCWQAVHGTVYEIYALSTLCRIANALGGIATQMSFPIEPSSKKLHAMPITSAAADPKTFHQLLAHAKVTRVAVATRSSPWQAALNTALAYRLAETHYVGSFIDVHAVRDVSHARTGIREIIRPLIDTDPECARFIAEVALMHLVCGERCFAQLNYPTHSHQSARVQATALR